MKFESSWAEGQGRGGQEERMADQLSAVEDLDRLPTGPEARPASANHGGCTTFTRPTRTMGWSVTRPTPTRHAASRPSVWPWLRARLWSSAACSFVSRTRPGTRGSSIADGAVTFVDCAEAALVASAFRRCFEAAL